MEPISSNEIERQYRVLRQTLGMHSILRGEFLCKAKLLEIILLLCSVVFCATVFAADRLYLALHLSPETCRIFLGITSIIAFAVSLMLTALDWRGRAIQHGDAMARWSNALEQFRIIRTESGEWPESARSALSALYWEVSHNTAKIPDARFNRLKTRYLRKVELSQLKSKYPGCPKACLWGMFIFKDSHRALRDFFGSNDR